MKTKTIKYWMAAGLLLLAFCWACSSKSRIRENAVLDESPAPVGGFKEIQKNLFYPEFARKDGIEGEVLVEAIIDERGEIVETKIIESLGAECDKEAIRAIQSVRWKPATKQGIPVRSQVSIPINFKLQKMHPNND
jgi:TonB family protein